MRNSVLKIVSFYFLVILCLGKSYAQTVYLPHYTTKDGLPSNNCYYTLQDQKGFIWIATDAGVSRFDGAVFENFSVDDGLPDNQILQLREDSKGRIWFMALNGQLSYFLNGKIHNERTDTNLKELNLNGVVVSFLEDSKGRLWFGTNNNIIGVWDGKKTTKIISNSTEQKYQNVFIYEDEKNDIRAVNSTANFIFSNGLFIPSKTKIHPVSYKAINRINGKIYFLNQQGLSTIEKGITKEVLKINPHLLNSNLGYILLGEKKLWFSNDDGVNGINLDGSGGKRFLQSISVNQTIRDNQGNLWFTTKNGIYKLPKIKDQLYTFGKEDGLKGPNIKSIVKDKNNRLWLGSNNSSINILDLKTKKTIQVKLPDASKYNTIKQLVVDKTNKRIFFASDYGLGSVSSNYPLTSDFKFLKETNNLMFVVKNFAIDSTSKLTLSMSSGVVIINDRNQLQFSSFKYKEEQDFFKDRSYRVFYDKQQNLWFSNINGLSEFNYNKLNKHYERYPLLTKRINDIRQMADGSIAMATDGYGIVIFKDGKITHIINNKKGLNNNIINKLFVRGEYLWAISNTGINRISILNGGISINTFDDVNGILSDDLNDLYIDKDTAYFATNNGLVYFAYNHSLQNTEPPKIYINSIINNKKALDLTSKNFILKPNEQNLIINYSAIDFKNRNISYRYRLKNRGTWIETKNRRLELSSLEPGEYTFEVSAKSQNSSWSEPTKIKLVLERRFHQSWWFISILIVIGGFLIYVIGVRITKRQKNKEQEQLLLKNKILMLEQQALQAMMNPHFVFNVMNSIQHFINTKNTMSANKVLTGFARLIRKNLEICTQSYISLEEEINYLNLYLSLEKNRFGEKFQYAIEVDDAIDKEEALIPSMLLQPYIENAIWHGIMPKEEGGKVTISIKEVNDDTLLISIIDDGIGIDNSLSAKKDGHQSKGMDLTNERINLLNKIEAKAIQLNIKQNGKTGTIVSISIPMNR
ncbi:sensor histidine kinase [Pedobacter xixiisoli]|uniref:Two component regulator propeller n=1 Tax=Pedobacter xixiisoli TaxID=1476464 RepID=A0A285ZNW5_9SPHI|nr:sensor histidine kinase [Pedobacter xixiisoli]SOD11342.1 Two component regulator propeller [Pedobacter xixiisoli]